MKKLLPVIAGLLILVSIGFKVYNKLKPTKSVEFKLVEMAEEVNKNLPKKINEDVTAESVAAGPGKLIQYNFILDNVNLNELDLVEFKKTMRPQLEKSIDGNPQMKFFKAKKVAVKFSYYTKNKKLIADFLFDNK